MLSPSVVKFFNMSEHDPALLQPPTTLKTPKTTTKNHRNNSKNNKQTASTSSPKPNRHNKLPHKNNNNNIASQQPSKVAVNGLGARQAPRNKDRTNNNRTTGNLGNKNSPHRQNCRQQQQPNESNHSDSSLSVSSKTSSSNNKQSSGATNGSSNTTKGGFVKLATLTNKSDSDSGEKNNYQHAYNTRGNYRNKQKLRQRNDESFSFENVAPNSEMFAGSSSAPDAKSLPPPPTAWLSSFNVPKNINSAPNVIKNQKTNKNNNNGSSSSPTQLRPTVQNLFASMSLVQASA